MMNSSELGVRDALVAPVWLLATALLIVFVTRVGRAAFPRDRLPQLAMSATLLYIGTIIGAVTLLGACHLLMPPLLLMLVTLVAVTGLGMRGILYRKGDGAREPALAWTGQFPNSHDRWLWTVWLLLLACLLGHLGNNALLAFPTEFDELAYHIPLIDHWLQAQSLCAYDAAWWWTPANGEIVGLWIVAPFSGDFLIALGNVMFIVLWVLAAIETARIAGFSSIWCHLATLSMLAVHTTFHESSRCMNDVALSACFFAAVAYGFRHLQSRQLSDLTLAGVAIGLLAGVKYFALGYAALITAVVVAGAGLLRGWRAMALPCIVLGLTSIPFGGLLVLSQLLAHRRATLSARRRRAGDWLPAPLGHDDCRQWQS